MQYQLLTQPVLAFAPLQPAFGAAAEGQVAEPGQVRARFGEGLFCSGDSTGHSRQKAEEVQPTSTTMCRSKIRYNPAFDSTLATRSEPRVGFVRCGSDLVPAELRTAGQQAYCRHQLTHRS